MSLLNLVREQVKNGADLVFGPDGSLYSMNPPETLFGFTYHAHMVPPYKPASSLILGYGMGTVPALMRKVWGPDVKVTGVDTAKQEWSYIEYKMKVMDAWDYIKDCTDSIIKTRFDYIAVDLWDGKKVPEFVFDDEFAVRLREMSKKMICLNTTDKDFKRLKPFYDYGFNFERHVQIDANIISWWSVIEK